MKKISVFASVVLAAFVFSYCSSSKKAAVLPPAKITYQANIVPIIQASCTPCHVPDKGGNKKPLNTYNAMVTQYDEAVRRIQLNPSDRGFMPNRKPNKLSDSTINVFKQWKTDGMLEK